MPEIIFDNCVLSNFALVNNLDIIRLLYKRKVYVTNFVLAKNLKGIHSGYDALKFARKSVTKGWINTITIQTEKETSLFETLSISLGLGEALSSF